MPKRAHAGRTATRKRFSLDELRAQVAGAIDCASDLFPVIGVVNKCQGPCLRCAELAKTWEAERPDPPAPSLETLIQLVRRADVRSPEWPAARQAVADAVDRLDEPEVRRALGALLRALPPRPPDTYPTEEEI